MGKKIDIAGELNAATVEGIIADGSQIRQEEGKNVKDAINELTSKVNNINRIFDGGRSDTIYGGGRTINCGDSGVD